MKLELVSIASGSSGNCIYIGNNDHHILIDAGISGKRVEAGLNELDLSCRDMDGIFVTHEHADHISGLGVLARRYHLPIYGTEGTLDAIKYQSNVGKIDEELFHVISPEMPCMIGDIEICPISTSHDAADPVAYIAKCGGKKAGVITDLGTYDEEIIRKLKGVSVLLLEANHDVRMLQSGRYPYYLKKRILGDSGHLSNENSGKLLCRLLHDGFEAVMLGHLSKENNYPDLAYETVRMEIELSDIPYRADDFPIYVADRSCVSQKLAC
jgi:phosphoribosyl 1,2-cyclic phosphodiesterase